MNVVNVMKYVMYLVIIQLLYLETLIRWLIQNCKRWSTCTITISCQDVIQRLPKTYKAKVKILKSTKLVKQLALSAACWYQWFHSKCCLVSAEDILISSVQ
jgi:hypothetical protein